MTVETLAVQAITDERQRLYQRAITEREYLPIRGRWAVSVRKDKERKRQERRNKNIKRSFIA